MKRLNLFDMYNTGKLLAAIADLESEVRIQDVFWGLWQARTKLQELVAEGSPLLGSSKRAASTLIQAITDVIPLDWNLAFNAGKDGATLGFSGYPIRTGVAAFETVLANEMPDVAAYVVSQRGIYRTDDLVERANHHVASDVIDVLPKQAEVDLKDAGKCLAYELPTACAFHLWRAVETVMKTYYLALTGKGFNKNARNWGKYIEALQQAGADNRVTAFLDHIRDSYRNPQTHPEKPVKLVEAQMLFAVAVSAIDQMLICCKELDLARALPPATTSSVLLGGPPSGGPAIEAREEE